MDFLTTSLLIAILVLLIFCAISLKSVHRRGRWQTKQIERLSKNQDQFYKALKSAPRTQSPKSVGTDALRAVHTALANQLTLAGENLDKKVSSIIQQLAPSGPHPAVFPEAGHPVIEPERFSRAFVAREFNIIRKGIVNEPSRHLNLVHGIPKSGNTSLLSTLWASPETIGSAFSSHFLSSTALQTVTATVERTPTIPREFEHVRQRCIRKMLGELGYLNDWLRSGDSPPPTHPLKVICPFREPIASSISLRAYRGSGGAVPHMDIKFPLSSGVPSEHPEGFSAWMSLWADNELNNLYGIDLLSLPFDTERGFSIYRRQSIHLLVITLEAMSHLKDALAELYDCSPNAFNPVKSNDAAARADAASYKELLSSFRVPAPMAERIYNSPLIRRLYSDKQRESFINRWSAR